MGQGREISLHQMYERQKPSTYPGTMIDIIQDERQDIHT